MDPVALNIAQAVGVALAVGVVGFGVAAAVGRRGAGDVIGVLTVGVAGVVAYLMLGRGSVGGAVQWPPLMPGASVGTLWPASVVIAGVVGVLGAVWPRAGGRLRHAPLVLAGLGVAVIVGVQARGLISRGAAGWDTSSTSITLAGVAGLTVLLGALLIHAMTRGYGQTKGDVGWRDSAVMPGERPMAGQGRIVATATGVIVLAAAAGVVVIGLATQTAAFQLAALSGALGGAGLVAIASRRLQIGPGVALMLAMLIVTTISQGVIFGSGQPVLGVLGVVGVLGAASAAWLVDASGVAALRPVARLPLKRRAMLLGVVIITLSGAIAGTTLAVIGAAMAARAGERTY
jgi:hypothetical protein